MLKNSKAVVVIALVGLVVSLVLFAQGAMFVSAY